MAALVSLNTYKAIKGISSTTNDFALTTFVDSASQMVKTYCNNSFTDFFASDKTETFSINWKQHIVQLTESPVNSITSVKERENLSDTYTTLTTNQFFLESNTDTIYRVNDGGHTYKSFPVGPGAVEVQYKAGYETVPEDLKLAVVDLITYYFREESKARQTIAGASRQHAASTTQRDNVGFPDHIKRVLDMYKSY